MPSLDSPEYSLFQAFVSDKNIFNKTFHMICGEQATTGSTVHTSLFASVHGIVLKTWKTAGIF